MIPTSIDGTDITGATIDGTDVQEITVDGQTVFSAGAQLPDTEVWQTHRWLFYEGSGTTVEDDIGTLNADFNDLTWESGEGVGDFYVQLDGIDQAGDLGPNSRNLSDIINSGQGAVGGWIKPDSDTGRRHIFGNGVDTFNRTWAFWYETNDDIRFDASTSSDFGDTYQIIESGVITDGEWQSLIFSADGSTGRLYVDGTEVGSDSLGNTDSGDLESRNVWFGTDPDDSGRYFPGAFDHWWYSDQHVTDSEIQDWHNDTSGFFD